MLGDTAVGKSSLVSQFMTSEYLHAYDTSIGKSYIHVNISFFCTLSLCLSSLFKSTSQFAYIGNLTIFRILIVK